MVKRFSEVLISLKFQSAFCQKLKFCHRFEKPGPVKFCNFYYRTIKVVLIKVVLIKVENLLEKQNDHQNLDRPFHHQSFEKSHFHHSVSIIVLHVLSKVKK